MVIGIAAWPLALSAQDSIKPRVIGMLSGLAQDDVEARARIASFRKGLQELGRVDGRNIRIESRWAGGDTARLREYASELVRLKPDVILAAAGSALQPLRRETQTIPIVFAQISDPVSAGIVQSLARPAGNITGFATTEYGVAVKWVELLKQIAARVTRVAVIYQPGLPQTEGLLREIKAGAQSLGLQVSTAPVRNSTDIEKALTAFAREPHSGLIFPPGPVIATNRDLIVTSAAQQGMPAVYPYRFFVVGGGLASYGIDNHDLYRRAALYVNRILNGEKPGDLPIQLADKYELVINLKAAKTLGLEVPITLLARTDEVIE